MGKFLGGTIQDGVAAQLQARTNYLKAGKFENGLSALHGTSPFINLYSSVGGADYDPSAFKLEGGLAFQGDIISGNTVVYSG
jgi:hypothetical protein